MCNILNKRIEETKVEVIKALTEYGKCAILRPTGFGKTVLMCKIADERYKRVMYVYPTDVIKQNAEKRIKKAKVDFVSYMKIGKQHNKVKGLYDIIKKQKYDLIIFDEIHHMGAKFVKETLDELYKLLENTNIHILGGTATPKRMDGFDVVGKYFDNRITSFYGLDRAIGDGIMPVPYYVYALDGYKEEVKKVQNKLKDTPEEIKEAVQVDLRKYVRQLNKITNAEDIISEAITKVYNNNIPKYMRFVVFFPTKKSLNDRHDEVVSWFENVFEKYRIRPTSVYSDSIAKQNIKNVYALDKPDYTIDLILSINMINEGYHIDDLTGVIMMRPTQSPVVYTQQVGRCIQVNMPNTPIIFDFVANINIHSLYDVNFEQSKKITDKSENELSISEYIERLNKISKEHIHIVDNVASVKKVINKMNSALPTNTEASILMDRMDPNVPYPAHFLAEKHKVGLWEVYNILEKYDDLLRPLNRHKQEGDLYISGNIHGKRVD